MCSSARRTRCPRTASRSPGPWCCSASGGWCSRRRPGGWWSRVADTAAAGRRTHGRVYEGLRAYGLITAMWIRSTMAYRASFVMTTLGNFAATGLDFVAIMLMFSRIDSLGGYRLPEVAFLYGL